MTPRRQLVTGWGVAAGFGWVTRTISRWTREGRLTPTTKLPGKTGAYLYDASQIQKLAKRAKPVVEAPKAAS